MRIFWKIPPQPQLSLTSGFYIKICFESDSFIANLAILIYSTNQPLIKSFYIKNVPIFCWISDESVLIRNFLRSGRARVNPQIHSYKWIKIVHVRNFLSNFKTFVIATSFLYMYWKCSKYCFRLSLFLRIWSGICPNNQTHFQYFVS